MMWALVWFVIMLLLLLSFILVGISAFGKPGTFGAIINSIFPVRKNLIHSFFFFAINFQKLIFSFKVGGTGLSKG